MTRDTRVSRGCDLPMVVVSLSGSLPSPASELLSDTLSSCTHDQKKHIQYLLTASKPQQTTAQNGTPSRLVLKENSKVKGRVFCLVVDPKISRHLF